MELIHGSPSSHSANMEVAVSRPMPILEILPPEIFRMILQFLSPLGELVLLDQALLNHRLRLFYLRTIERMPISGVKISPERSWRHEDYDFWAVNWLLSRKIISTDLYFSDFNHPSFPLLIVQSRLVLQSLSIHQETPQMMDDSLFLSLGHMPSLTSLNIFELHATRISSFIHFLSLNPRLKELSLPHHSDPSGELVYSVSQTCVNLRKLYAAGDWFGDDHVTLLTQGRLSKLEELVLLETSVQAHDSIVNILKAFPVLKSFQLDTSELSPTTKVYYLNEYALPCLKSGDPALQRLGLEGFDHVFEVRLWLFLSVLTSSS
jgi:hypothetical protein